MDEGSWNKDMPKQENMAVLLPMKLKQKAGKCTVVEPEVVSKTNNALLKAVVNLQYTIVYFWSSG